MYTPTQPPLPPSSPQPPLFSHPCLPPLLHPLPLPPLSIHREGIYPPPDVTTRTYSSVAETLETGDIVLFSGATSSGAIIKFFDRSQFSHIGLVRS